MEIRQLSYVEAVARYGGFTRAAGRLHVAQSAVSAQVRALEIELGVTLFARTTRKVALTPAGEMFVARARRILAELDGARGEMAEITAVVSGRVSVGATADLGPYRLAAALASFRDRHPGIAVRLRSGRVTGLLGACDNGELDLVVGPVHADLPPRFDALPLVEEQLVLALPPGHPMARSGRFTLGEVRDEPFVSMPPGSGLRWILEDAARSAGFLPRVHFETAGPDGIRELVAAGLGVGLLSRGAAETPAGPPIEVCHLHPPPAHPPIGVMRQRDRALGPAAQSLRHHLVEAAGLSAPADPGLADPGLADPGPADPGPAGPEAVCPETAGPEAAAGAEIHKLAHPSMGG